MSVWRDDSSSNKEGFRLEPKLSGVSKEKGNGVVTKKGEHVWGKIMGAYF